VEYRLDNLKYSNSNTFTMLSTEYLFVQYVVCTINEGNKDMVMNMTFNDAINIISQAGLEVTEYEDDISDFCDEEY